MTVGAFDTEDKLLGVIIGRILNADDHHIKFKVCFSETSENTEDFGLLSGLGWDSSEWLNAMGLIWGRQLSNLVTERISQTGHSLMVAINFRVLWGYSF